MIVQIQDRNKDEQLGTHTEAGDSWLTQADLFLWLTQVCDWLYDLTKDSYIPFSFSFQDLNFA